MYPLVLADEGPVSVAEDDGCLLYTSFPEFPGFVWSVNQKSSHQLLLELPTPDAIAGCHLTRLTNLIQKSSHGKYGREKAVALRDLAASSIGLSDDALSLIHI